MIVNGQKRTQIKDLFFHFYIFNKDISLNIYDTNMKCSTGVKRIRREGTMSQIFDLGLIFHFILKKTPTFYHFFIYNFLHCIR